MLLLLCSIDSFTLSDNLTGLLSSIANVGCRSQLLEALFCIIRYAIKTLHKFLQAKVTYQQEGISQLPKAK